MASGVRKPYSPGPHRPSILAVAADGSRGVCAVPGWTSSRENMPSPAQIRQPLQGEARGTAGPGIVIGVSEARRRRNLLLALCPAGVRMGSFCAGCVLSWFCPVGRNRKGKRGVPRRAAGSRTCVAWPSEPPWGFVGRQNSIGLRLRIKPVSGHFQLGVAAPADGVILRKHEP